MEHVEVSSDEEEEEDADEEEDVEVDGAAVSSREGAVSSLLGATPLRESCLPSPACSAFPFLF